tara:strand:- start:8939 stop:9265 length:327 start_codon:yes stop_codon:yes gene_type:complete
MKIKKTYLKKDDNVQIMTGRDKGKKGRIISINRLKYTAIVEGANLVSKHTKPNQDNPKGGVIKKEASINISNLLLVDSKGKPSKIGKRINKKTGKKERFFKTTGDLVK